MKWVAILSILDFIEQLRHRLLFAFGLRLWISALLFSILQKILPRETKQRLLLISLVLLPLLQAGKGIAVMSRRLNALAHIVPEVHRRIRLRRAQGLHFAPLPFQIHPIFRIYQMAMLSAFAALALILGLLRLQSAEPGVGSIDAHHQLPIEVLLDLNLPHLFMRVEAVASHQGGCALPEARARRVIHRLIRIIRSMISHLHLLNSLTWNIRLLRRYASRNH